MKRIFLVSVIFLTLGLIVSAYSEANTFEKDSLEIDYSLNEDTIKSKQLIQDEALVLFRKSDSLQRTKGFDFMECINLLDMADSIEPNNPIILETRGRIKFNFHYDLESAFDDFAKAISCAYDQEMKERMYVNRGLSYMQICDIKSACNDWLNAGKYGENYRKTYCAECCDSVFEKNLDDRLELELKVASPSSKIISTHNHPEMSICNATLTITNIDHKPITIKKSFLEYDLASENTDLYLEAKDSEGKKITFFSPNKVQSYGTKDDFILSRGKQFEVKLNLTHVHHFYKTGIYQIRLCLRPEKYSAGLENTYYSNWVELEVTK